MTTYAITGATGFVGSALTASLMQDGHHVVRIGRSSGHASPVPRLRNVTWDPAAGRLDPAGLEGVDAVVHLAGESVAGGRWTTARKTAIRQSRVQGTTLLARTLAGMQRRPAVLVSASAIGIYGNRGDEVLDETATHAQDFLGEVAREWEAATMPAQQAGIRVVHARIGIVLGWSGGALARMRLPFLLGLGGPLGDGRQYMSWISLTDAVRALRHCADDAGTRGAVNLTAPQPATNREFTRTLGRVLRRPAFLPAPAFALRMLLGEMADALLLQGQRVVPAALQRSGFRFVHEQLESALREG